MAEIDTVTLPELSHRISHISKCIPCFYDETRNTVIKIQIPDASLHGLPSVRIESEENVVNIPNVEGNYWILTDEPVNHCLHSGKSCPTKLDNGLTVVYNGVSSCLRDRSKEHLLREDSKGGFGAQSGISLDILKDDPSGKSHAKCMWAPKKKLPKVLIGGTYKKPSSKNEVIGYLNLSEEEKEYANSTDELYFKNGINVMDAKHKPYQWIFVFAAIPEHSIRDFVENEWRKMNGVPVLCSYTSGR